MTGNAEIGLRFESAIKEHGIKLEVVADKLGITRKTLHRKLTGETDLKLVEAIEIVRILRLTESEARYIILGTK